jgi:D-alanine-D-alanine ligase
VAKKRVLILYGGRSSEHQVSCLSARSVLRVIDRDRYDVVPVGITREGRWVLTDGAIEPEPGEALPHVADDGSTVSLIRTRKGPTLVRFDGDRYDEIGPVDVAFPVLHGPYGEDGTVQGFLATVGVPYVGADVTSSSVGIDKRAMKNAFKARGLPQIPYLAIRRERWEADRGEVLDDLEGALDYPMFTKPARQGSSIGITKASDRAELEAGLDEAFTYDRYTIVEEGVRAPRELEVGALGNQDIDITAPGEIVPSHEFYDFEAKYLDASELRIPAEVDDEVARRIDEIARQAYLAIGCRGMARIDFFLSADTGELYINEINTIPGFTPASMFPQLWQAEGLEYPGLVDRLLDLALEATTSDANFAP